MICKDCKIHADNWCKICFNNYASHRYHTNKKTNFLAKARDKRWRDNNKEKVKLKNKIKQETDKQKVISHYSNGSMKCAKCPSHDIRALSIDHIDGDGYKLGIQSRAHLYRELIKNNFPEGLQVLCMSCQFIKKHEQQEYYKGIKKE